MMLAPLHDGGLLISTHAYAALTALVLGAFQLALPKGTPLHRNIGRLWVGLIGIVAISSFFINDIRQFGAFSLIHLLSLLTPLFFGSIHAGGAQRGYKNASANDESPLFFML